MTEIVKIPKRFETLDAWRGICACLIVFYHFKSLVISHFDIFPMTANAYILVDFFFVLSGFVISFNYQEKLLNDLAIKDYIFLRLGRIYPLHFFMLICFFAFDCTKLFIDAAVPPFQYKTSPEAFLASVFLVQSLGIFNHATVNAPAWSISVEFYTYIVYALALVGFRRKIWIPATIILIATPFVFIALGKYRMDITFDYGFLRCIYGFSAGILCYKTYQYLSRLNIEGFKFFTLLESTALLLIICLVSFCSNNYFSFWSPYIFSLSLLVFAFERGAISRILLLKPFLFLGALSYSIYMIHTFIQVNVLMVAKLFQKILHIDFFRPAVMGGENKELLGHTAWQGDLIQIGTFVIVIVAATLTYNFIEVPANRWFRRYIQKKQHVNVPEGSSAAF